jgi:hypothetical protein
MLSQKHAAAECAHMLDTNPNFDQADNFYQKLIDLHDGKSDTESMKINAKLVLLLANHIGDEAIIDEAIAIAATY